MNSGASWDDQSHLVSIGLLAMTLVLLQSMRRKRTGLGLHWAMRVLFKKDKPAARERSFAEPANQLAVRVKEREDEGDVRGAMELLLAHHKAYPTQSRAVELAHDLSQRYPNIFDNDGCPIRREEDQSPRSVEGEHDLLSPQGSTKEGTKPGSNDGRDPDGPTEPIHDSPSSSSVGSLATPSRPKKGEETPWERGWKGAEGFKPPVSDDTGRASDGSGETISQRNFTIAQLNTFDGERPRSRGKRPGGEEPPRPIYISIRGNVYDASSGRHLYGAGGEYCAFAGHDISRRVARGVEPGTATKRPVPDEGRADEGNGDAGGALDNLSLEGLGRFEKMTLAGWEDTFAAKGYPVVGRVLTPPPPRQMSRAELRAFDGSDRGRASVPPGYATPPIYLGVRDRVFDVSFGGSEFYSRGGEYHRLAGRDASRVLARMSMDPADVEGLLDYQHLTEREKKNLDDWVKRLGEGKGYPVVGWLALDGD